MISFHASSKGCISISPLIIANSQEKLNWKCRNVIIPSLTVEEQKNGCKASKIKACNRFLFRSDMCYCAIFFCLWQIYFFCLFDDASHRRFFDEFIVGSKTESFVQGICYFGPCVGRDIAISGI